jgi:hypothetical protein
MITSYEQWLIEYRKDKYKVWIRATLSNNTECYLPDHKEWMQLKEHCAANKLSVIRVGLQYRSNSIEIDTSDTDGVYLVRSLIGMMGETSRQTITIGKLYGTTVKKTLWITPELIEEISTEDHIDECFKEALILNYDKETRVI